MKIRKIPQLRDLLMQLSEICLFTTRKIKLDNNVHLSSRKGEDIQILMKLQPFLDMIFTSY